MYQYHNECPYHQDDAVLGNRSPVVTAFVGERAGCTEHLYYGDQAKEQENNPYYLVTLEYIFNQILCLVILHIHQDKKNNYIDWYFMGKLYH